MNQYHPGEYELVLFVGTSEQKVTQCTAKELLWMEAILHQSCSIQSGYLDFGSCKVNNLK